MISKMVSRGIDNASLRTRNSVDHLRQASSLPSINSFACFISAEWISQQLKSAGTPCEVPEFTGITWGDGGLYAMELKRELRICKGRLDEVIDWRQNVGRKT
ncbi:TPA: Rz1-like lysis system protein LysC [Yersinia enterocolitica]